MSRVKIQIFRKDNSGNKELVRTVWLERDSNKALTAKRAGQLLANNFPEFDELLTRNGLLKNDECFFAQRSLEPTEKCSYHYIWEYAHVTEED
jgi:hypothetical protein